MGMLKWFNRDRYSGLGEVLGAIKKELEALQPQDSSDIVWSRDRGGLSAKLRSNAVSGEVVDENEEATTTKTAASTPSIPVLCEVASSASNLNGSVLVLVSFFENGYSSGVTGTGYVKLCSYPGSVTLDSGTRVLGYPVDIPAYKVEVV